MKQCKHQRGCYWTHGFECEDCGKFIHKKSDEYKSTFGLSSLWMVLWNVKAEAIRKGNAVDQRIDTMLKRIDSSKNHKERGLETYNDALRLIREFGKRENSAVITLK